MAAAAEAIFTADALSTLHALAHCSVGAVPVVPFWPEKLAPVLDRVNELAASVWPPLMYPGPESDPQVAFGQYCLKTALLPPAALPLTVTFHPAPEPVASSTEKFVIVVLVVCACPFRVIAVNVGSAGAVANDSDPPVTLNVVWSFEVAASALAGASTAASATVAAAAAARIEIEIPLTFTSVLLD
ncbi:MAG TPA: hypothetical protein VGN29_17925 [Solirubrobacteraceae bacterium]|nr:hypothetical protein [Solirubrobacteraceae bacterium]